MPSPFPGMDPYLEHVNFWHDFHGVFVTIMRLELAGQLRGRYDVRMDDNVYIHELSAEERRPFARPDVLIVGGSDAPATRSSPSAALLEAPVRGELPIGVDVLRERFVEIRDRETRKLITAVELLSPANKAGGADREQYLSKRRQYLASQVNLVEIDLLRAGHRMPVSNLPECDYCAIVSPGAERPNAGIWAWGLRDPLPDLPIPLGYEETPIRVPLRRVFDRTYDEGAYAPGLYAHALTPPLSSEEDEWANGIAAGALEART
jgi:hypothetical protein